MDLTTTASVNQRRGQTDVEDATLIGRLVTEVSADAELYVARGLELTSRTETYKLPRRADLLRLNAYPVTAVALVEVSTSPKFATSPTTLGSSSYDWESHADTGLFYFVEPNAWQDQWVRITYTGGMAADTASFMSAHPAISGAIEEQILAMLEHVGQPEVTKRSYRGGGQETTDSQNWQPNVRRRLDMIRRRFA